MGRFKNTCTPVHLSVNTKNKFKCLSNISEDLSGVYQNRPCSKHTVHTDVVNPADISPTLPDKRQRRKKGKKASCAETQAIV